MRHANKGRKLGRNASHRKATLNALATALFKHKRIRTTVAKAKEARSFAESLITKAKDDTVHSRRQISKVINDRAIVQELFNEIVPKVGDRPGGYTRVIKLGRRLGDAAEMAILELVDFNDIANQTATDNKEKREERKAATKEENVEDANVIEETEDNTPEVEDKESEEKSESEEKKDKEENQ